MRAMFITHWYIAPSVASEALDVMFLVRRNLAGDWEPVINGRTPPDA
jgi:hypothetical protein